MDKIKLILVTSTVLILWGVMPMSSLSYNELPSEIRALVENGEFSQAQQEIRRFLEQSGDQIAAQQKERLLYEVERLDRIRKDFHLTRDQVFESLKKEILDLKLEEFDRWDKAGLVDSRIIDGKRYYFTKESEERFYFKDREDGIRRFFKKRPGARLAQSHQYTLDNLILINSVTQRLSHSPVLK